MGSVPSPQVKSLGSTYTVQNPYLWGQYLLRRSVLRQYPPHSTKPLPLGSVPTPQVKSPGSMYTDQTPYSTSGDSTYFGVDLSLAAWKMRKNYLVKGGFRDNFTESQAAMHFY
jgi:hypothetical protein